MVGVEKEFALATAGAKVSEAADECGRARSAPASEFFGEAVCAVTPKLFGVAVYVTEHALAWPRLQELGGEVLQSNLCGLEG